MSTLRQTKSIPPELYDCSHTELYKLLGGPTLFYIEGKRNPPLFITVLQHGNEPTGFDAIQQILGKYRHKELPRSMWLFIANVKAAETSQRVLNAQLDFNRAWPGTTSTQCPETELMAQVVQIVTKQPLFASVDLHNNTGHNPHYGCVNKLENNFLQLATLFSRTIVYFRQPVGVQSLAMAEHCTAVTLECGQAGEHAALAHAIEYIDACLHLHHFPQTHSIPNGTNLLKTAAVAKVKSGTSFGFDEESFRDGQLDICFRQDLDHFNFGLLKQGETLAKIRSGIKLPMVVIDENGKDIVDELFTVKNGKVIVNKTITPSMATLDTYVIKRDCLFYLMKEINVAE